MKVWVVLKNRYLVKPSSEGGADWESPTEVVGVFASQRAASRWVTENLPLEVPGEVGFDVEPHEVWAA